MKQAIVLYGPHASTDCLEARQIISAHTNYQRVSASWEVRNYAVMFSSSISLVVVWDCPDDFNVFGFEDIIKKGFYAEPMPGVETLLTPEFLFIIPHEIDPSKLDVSWLKCIRAKNRMLQPPSQNETIPNALNQ